MLASGENAVVRFRSIDGRFHSGRPVRVVEHTPDALVTYMAEGTIVSVPMLADGRGLRDVPLDERWAHPRTSALRPWHDTELIQVFPHNRAHSVWVVRDTRREVVGWYVNLEAVHEVAERTITTQDHVLDIWVPADTREPQWKDEDELEAAVRVGRLTRAQALAVRAEGERVWRERPWPTGWEDWVPPEDWTTPELPVGWNRELRTERLRLVPLAREHASAYAAFMDEEQAARELAESEAHWAGHGFGPWALLDGDDFVGFAEVHYCAAGVEGIAADEVELGWVIDEDRQGKGLATEAMRAAIADAWDRAGVAHLTAYIRPENAASLRVAEKLGFRPRGAGRTRSGDPMTVFVLHRDA
jgi:RimJ/RimL family protein N-acetyltransferase